MQLATINPLVPRKKLCFRSTLLAVFFSGLSSLTSAQTVLITDEEAKLPNAQALSTRAITRGPSIKLTTPAEVSAKSFALKLDIEARGGAKIDTGSLKVEYLKQPIVDLTARFKAGLQGHHIDLHEIKVPQGQHPIKVSIKDSEGREGTQVIQLVAK